VKEGDEASTGVVVREIQGRCCDFLVELQLRERGEPRSGALVVDRVRRDWSSRPGSAFYSTTTTRHHHEAARARPSSIHP
jgi:hypothetical protein